MRRSVIALVLAVALGPWSPAVAQYYPQGSYQQSCTHLRMNGPILSAVCSASNGGAVRSSIDTATCPNGYIENRSGYLACNGSSSGGDVEYSLPAGSYSQSCQDVSMRGPILRGHCQTSGGTLVFSRVDMRACPPRSQVANINGNLVCQAGGYDGRSRRGDGDDGVVGSLPPGTYQQSCRNLRMDGAVLRGACQIASGGYNNTALNITRCQPGSPINNVNGYLECAAYRNR